MFYTQLVVHSNEEEYTCKATKDLKEEIELVEHGFQYVTQTGEYKLYRKRKITNTPLFSYSFSTRKTSVTNFNI
jgi:hypothetical protein